MEPLLNLAHFSAGVFFGHLTACYGLLEPLSGFADLYPTPKLPGVLFRYFAFFDNLYLRNKVAGFLTVGFLGFGLENAIHTMEEFTYGLGMIRAARATVTASTLVLGKRPAYLEHGVLDDKRWMNYVKIVGHRVVELARIVKYATSAGIVPPTPYNLSTGASIKEREKVFRDGVWREEDDKS